MPSSCCVENSHPIPAKGLRVKGEADLDLERRPVVRSLIAATVIVGALDAVELRDAREQTYIGEKKGDFLLRRTAGHF